LAENAILDLHNIFWFIRLLVEQAAIRELKKANLMILTLITADFL